MYLGVKKSPARKHRISFSVLWCAESNGYNYTFFFLLTSVWVKFKFVAVAGLSEMSYVIVLHES
jgi:hypothetical protein